MGAFLIVVFELLILLFGFWYVFIRTPRPYTVDKPIWGVYEGHAEELSKENQDVLVFSDKFSSGVSIVGPNNNPRAPKGPRRAA